MAPAPNPAHSGQPDSKQARQRVEKSIALVVAPLGELEADISIAGPYPDRAPVEMSAMQYNLWQKEYVSKTEAFRMLGVGERMRGHCARNVKSKGDYVFLRCNLQKSKSGCCWSRVLRTTSNGGVSLYRHINQGLSHNCASKLIGKRGMDDMAERKVLEKLMLEQTTATPRRALRVAPKSGKVKRAALTQAQKLKKVLMRRFFTAKVLGHLAQAVAPHTEVPADKTKGYFCFHETSKVGGRPKLSLVATTVALQERWIEGSIKSCLPIVTVALNSMYVGGQ